MRSGEQLRRDLRVAVATSGLQGQATEKQIGYLNGLLGKVLGGGDSGNVARHQFLEYVFGNASSKALSKAEASVLIDWLSAGEETTAESYAALSAWGVEHGQLRMELLVEGGGGVGLFPAGHWGHSVLTESGELVRVQSAPL